MILRPVMTSMGSSLDSMAVIFSAGITGGAFAAAAAARAIALRAPKAQAARNANSGTNQKNHAFISKPPSPNHRQDSSASRKSNLPGQARPWIGRECQKNSSTQPCPAANRASIVSGAHRQQSAGCMHRMKHSWNGGYESRSPRPQARVAPSRQHFALLDSIPKNSQAPSAFPAMKRREITD